MMEQFEKRIFFNSVDAPYQDLTNLLHESFKERLDANLNFGCATFTPEELMLQTKDAYIICFFDNNKPIAMGVLSIRNKFMARYGAFEFMAVAPEEKYRRKGLGGKVQRESICIAKTLGLDLVTSSTAVDAESSVKCHLKTGFKIYRLTHFPGRCYVSYCFYYPLKRTLLNLTLFLVRKPLVIITKHLNK